MAILSVTELKQLGLDVLRKAGAPDQAAASVIEALVSAELEGIASHGYARLPFYLDQALSGKIKADARPVAAVKAPAAVMVDAGFGFAFPAIEAGLQEAFPRALEQGVCALGVTRSHHCGSLGYHVEKCARAGLTALAFSNTPAAMAPWGGSKAVFGTNPVAFACPRGADDPLVIDLSLSKVARGKVVMAQKKGLPIPEGWALDANGAPTTDPDKALGGTMLPLGDAKGSALALIVEIMAAGLTGANFAEEASSMFTADGPPPGIGQFFILINGAAFTPGFREHVERLLLSISGQEGARLPGDRRISERAKRLQGGVELPDALFEDLRKRCQAV